MSYHRLTFFVYRAQPLVSAPAREGTLNLPCRDGYPTMNQSARGSDIPRDRITKRERVCRTALDECLQTHKIHHLIGPPLVKL